MTNFSEATSYANQLIAKYGDEREGLSRMLDRFEAHMNEGWGDAEADVIATALRAFLFPVTPARNLEALTAQIYEARSMNRVEDFASEVEAVAFVEARGVGSITKFIRDAYDGRERSCKHDVYRDGVWHGVDISR
jgi:hypothetical protein